MWCRAILATIAFTYIVCVLVLNGLQKEDLDISVLRKLQRHNVNIDDMNNEMLRNECGTVTRRSSAKVTGVDKISSVQTVPPDIISDKKEDLKIKLSDPSLQNIKINYFNNVPIINNTNANNKAKTDELKQSKKTLNVQNYSNLWNKLMRTVQDEIESTTKVLERYTTMTEITTFSYTPSASSKREDSNHMEYINKIIEKLISIQKITTTSRPTIKGLDYEFIAQKINEIFANNKNFKKNTESVTQQKYATNKTHEDIDITRKALIRNTDDIILTNPVMPIINNSNNINRNIESKTAAYQTKRQYLTEEENQNHKNEGINKQINSLSDDIIRQISEHVKEKVLADLKNVISTTTENSSKKVTMKTTTDRPKGETTTTDTKFEAKDVLQFMKMLQEYKDTKEFSSQNMNKTTQDKIIKTENAPLLISNSFTPIYNMYIKPQSVNVTSVIMNPLHTVISPNEHYTMLNINTPIQSLQTDAKPVQKITQLNIFNTKKNFHPQSITIQTNSYEVPPLGLTARESVVYQNIVVTTKQPIQYGRLVNRHRVHPDDKRYRNKHFYSKQPRDLYKDIETALHELNRDYKNNRHFVEDNSNPVNHEDYARMHHKVRENERFHKKLENGKIWPQITRSRENMNSYMNTDTPKFITRHQFPLHNVKKQSRYNDMHLRNFLKTQQKVNNMLERILATKTIADRPSSVESTV